MSKSYTPGYHKDCIFCQIVKGEMPSYKIWEDEDHIAFLSIFPNTDGFSVVATKRHYPSYAFEVSDDVLAKMILAVKKVARKLDAAFEDVSRTGMFYEGFGVDHLHAKLFPMHGTGDMEKWQSIESGQKRDFYEVYPGYLCSNDSLRAEDAKLNEIAEKIRSAKDEGGGVF